MSNFDEKVFMFPEAYNELRKELSTHWNPSSTGKYAHHMLVPRLSWGNWRCGWAMAFDAEEFVSYMNECLPGTLNVIAITNDDELRIGNICAVFLKELRKKRGEPNP